MAGCHLEQNAQIFRCRTEYRRCTAQRGGAFPRHVAVEFSGADSHRLHHRGYDRKAGSQLKLIVGFLNSIDHVDVDAAARQGIAVTNTPNVLTEDSADIIMTLVLVVPRRMIEGTRVFANGADEWRSCSNHTAFYRDNIDKMLGW